MLKRLYEKSRIWFAVAWIVAYCILMSVGDGLSELIGVEKSATTVMGILLSTILFLFLKRNGLFESYGLRKSEASAREMLYYIPVIVMLTANLWYGVGVSCGVVESILYILSMLCVGFLEEVIFRGLLFEAMRKSGLVSAVIVSSVTFGIGHIINLINGSGAELIPNLLQVLYATSAGFMFVMIYCRSKSLVSCIVTHGVFNALSVFSNSSAVTLEKQIISSIILTLVTGIYALILALGMRKDDFNSRA